MNTHEGYSKKTISNANVLLAGGGDKALSDFIGGIQYVSASKKLQYKTSTENASWQDLPIPFSDYLTSHLSVTNNNPNIKFGNTMTIGKVGSTNLQITLPDNEGTLNFTDNTELLTSYASNNGFADTNAPGIIYRRDAICMYNYIKAKLDSVYSTIHSHPYLPLAGGTMDSGAQITVGTITNSSGQVYSGGIQLRELNYSGASLTDNYENAPGITFHWSQRWVYKLNLHSDDLYWSNNKVWHAGNDGSGSGLDADLLDGHDSTYFAVAHSHPYLYSEQVSQTQTNVTWAIGYAKSQRRAFVYNTSSTEWSYLFGLSSTNATINNSATYPNYGAILKMGYSDKYLRILRVYGGKWYKTDGTQAALGSTDGVDWEKIYAGYADNAGNADKLDGYHASSFATSGHDHDGRYLKLAGGTMTGAIRRYYGSSTTDPMIALTSNDLDVWLWRINRGYNAIASASGLYGFGLKYLGTGSGNDKKLVLYADNLTGTLVAAMSMQQNGIISLIETPNVNGTNVSLVGHNHDDKYVTFVGVTDDTTNHNNLLRYVLNGVSNYFTVPYATYAKYPIMNSVNNMDMNTIKLPGFYYGYNMTNSANRTISTFLVLNYSGDWGNQLLFCSDNRIYHRRWTNSGGIMDTTWKTVAYTSDIPTVNNNSLSLQVNGTTLTTFYANDSTNRTFNVTCDNIGAATSEHSHGLTNSNFFKHLPSTSGNLTWKEAFGYNPNGALLMSVRIDSPAPSWCVGNYGSGILYGGGDTKGFMSSAYSSPYIMWAGGNGTTDSATPVWTMSISGANGGSYNLANFLTSQDHYKTSVTAGTAGTSSATSGSTLSVPYVTVNENGHVTGYGTHTHTISGFLTTLDHYKTSITAGTAGTSSDTSGATLAVPYVSMNANGHVTGYGTHTHSVTAVVGSYTSNGGQQNPNYFGTNRVGFLMMNTTVNNNSLYKDWMIMDCYGGNDVGGGVAIGVNRQSLGAYIMRSAAARTSWAESAELIGTHNYTTYCATAGHNHDDIYLKLSGGTMSGLITTTSGSSHNGIKVGDTYINAIGGELIFQNNTAIRFGGDSWDWNVWAELGYSHSNKIVYLGLSGSPYTTNSTQTGGKIYTPGISDIYIGNGTYKVWHQNNDGADSGLDADLLDGYHFSDLESRYVNVTGDIMTGGILMSSMEASGKRWMYGVTRNSGFKYDYYGSESFIISSGTHANSSISLYTSNRLSMNDSTGQWNSVTPDMRIKGTRVSINSDINTSYQLYVNGSTYSTGYYRADSSNSYILLGGGGHKLITDLISNGTYECLAYYSSSTKISSANSLKYTSDPGYLTVGNEAWISRNCIGFIDGMNIRFYDDSDDADPTDFPYIHDNISLFSGGYATIFDAYQPIVVSNDIRLVDPTNYSWKDLYANNGTFSGTLSASSGTFIGTLSALNSKFYVNSSGAFWTSDIRAKKDIHQITKEEVDKLFSTPDGYLKGFTFKDGDIKSFGVIAQEIIEYCPECIDEGELLHVNYDVALSKIMAGMYLKIKELEKEIEILRNR